jgi:hypothetical protein
LESCSWNNYIAHGPRVSAVDNVDVESRPRARSLSHI